MHLTRNGREREGILISNQKGRVSGKVGKKMGDAFDKKRNIKRRHFDKETI